MITFCPSQANRRLERQLSGSQGLNPELQGNLLALGLQGQAR